MPIFDNNKKKLNWEHMNIFNSYLATLLQTATYTISEGFMPKYQCRAISVSLILALLIVYFDFWNENF